MNTPVPDTQPLTPPSIGEMAANWLDAVSLWIARYTRWTRRSWLAALFLIAIALSVAWPNFGHFTQWRERWWEQAMDWKIDHPFAPIPVESYGEPGKDLEGTRSHLRKRTYRITVPLAAHVLGLHIRGAELLALVGSCGFLWMMFLNFRRLSQGDLTLALLLSVAMAASFVGQWAFNNFFFFDGVGYCFLAAACFARAPWLVALALFVGAFSDERVLVAVPLVYLLQSDSAMTELSVRDLWRLNRARVGTIGGVLLFVVARVIFGLHVGHLFDRDEVGLYRLVPNLLALPVDTLFVFKGAVLILLLGLLAGAFRRAWTAILLVAAAAAPSIAASMVVTDISRSLAYAFPLLLICTRALMESIDRRTVRLAALCAALFSVLIPTSYIWEDSLVTYTPLPFLAVQRAVSLVHIHR